MSLSPAYFDGLYPGAHSNHRAQDCAGGQARAVGHRNADSRAYGDQHANIYARVHTHTHAHSDAHIHADRHAHGNTAMGGN